MTATCGSLAQLVEQRLEEPCVLGSSPRGATKNHHAGVAQLIERFLAKEEATGLSPVTRTKVTFLIAPYKGSFFIFSTVLKIMLSLRQRSANIHP
jgi:hypothetical protein